MQHLLSKLYLGKHYRMERFGVMFLVLFFGLTSIVIATSITHARDSSQQLTNQALYTKDFAMSVTGSSGTVENVYTNTDRTKAFVLLKFDDVANISTLADEYKMYLTGSSFNLKRTKLNINPSGSIYMFGSTGYMGVYLTDARGFDKQILDLVVRGDTQLTKASDTVTKEVDTSFTDYDQFRVYFNPGADDAVVSDILNVDGELKVSDMYEAFITKPQEDEVRGVLSADLDTLKLDLDRIKEYKDRLITAQIQIPDEPLSIRGDSYTIDNNKTANDTSDDRIYLSTTTVVPGGFDFNWRDGSVKAGYLTALAGDKTFTNYLAAKFTDTVIAPCGDPKTCYTAYSAAGIEWRRGDGSLFVTNINSANATSVDVAIAKDIQNLQTAWQTYNTDKGAYQRVDLRKLLMMEADVAASNSNFTVNNSDGVLKNW